MAKQNGTYRFDLAAAETAGGVASILNPEGVDLWVELLVVEVDTKATAAATIDAGIAANGTTSADNLIDGADVGTAAGIFANSVNGGTNGKLGRKWGATEYLNISKASGAVAGLVGEGHVKYFALD